MGRPTLYTPELAAKVCHAIATNPVGIKRLCKEYPELPSHQTISNWISEKDDFFGQYLIAKERQAFIITEMLSDDIDNVDERPEAISKQTLRFRYYQWQLSKLAPKQFGDKKEIKQEMNLNVHEQDLQHLK